MKQIISFFSSTRLMAVLMVIFAVSIGVATFVENDFGTESAHKLIYNAKWFELLLLMACINIISVIIQKKMFKKEKLTLFVFHSAFLLIIAGAGITRYFGREGSMHIREGETAAKWRTSEAYLNVYVRSQNEAFSRAYPVLFSQVSKNSFNKTLRHAGHKIQIKLTEYLPNAEKILLTDQEGLPYIHLVTSSGQGREDIFLTIGQTLNTNTFTLSFVENPDTLAPENVVQLFGREGILYFYSPFPVIRLSMADQNQEQLAPKQIQPFFPAMLHNFDNVPIVVKEYMPSARIDAQASTLNENMPSSAVRLKISSGNETRTSVVFDNTNQTGQYSITNLNELEIAASYGPLEKELPFSLKLNDFILQRYPGSKSPSWFESNVQLIDTEKKIDQEKRIYMNHILKYRAYRFYQSSYDTDEGGTILAVNRDGIGTTVTYLGYLLMALGMLLSLANKNSRFIKLAVAKNTSGTVKVFLIGILISLTSLGFGQEAGINDEKDIRLPSIPVEKAKDFGKILVQDNGGRIEPVNTLASEVLRKLARKEEYKGLTPEQVLTGMIVFPDAWQSEPMIRVSHPEIQQILGIKTNYASFIDFFMSDQYGSYSLKTYVDQAYQKKPAYRTKFDNEVMRVDERLNIAYLVYSAAVFRMFPDPKDSTFTWHSPITAPEVFSKKDSSFSRNILSYYAEEVHHSLASNDWKNPDDIVKAIKIFQSNYGEKILPAHSRIQVESLYNNLNLYKHITNLYLLIGMLLLIIQFIHIFIPRFSIKWIFRFAFFLIALSFVFHTLALAGRWYIAGHAPWSNGYEALTFIAWATVLAGIIFSGRSQITLSATSVLAALILQTAHLSWMDPQITNLVPVLQSYWLVIHVAVITASYGFLGLGALVAAVNLLLLFFQNHKNQERLDMQINQITAVIEMALIAGLYLLSIGTFLGGVWANESWGRYWAWDPKETWALITVIVYAIILHLRLIPGMKGRVVFNITSLLGFGSVLMTYFGVNYYLSGLHSYAKGDPLPVPPIVYYSVAIVTILSLLAAYNQYRLNKSGK